MSINCVFLARSDQPFRSIWWTHRFSLKSLIEKCDYRLCVIPPEFAQLVEQDSHRMRWQIPIEWPALCVGGGSIEQASVWNCCSDCLLVALVGSRMIIVCCEIHGVNWLYSLTVFTEFTEFQIKIQDFSWKSFFWCVARWTTERVSQDKKTKSIKLNRSN